MKTTYIVTAVGIIGVGTGAFLFLNREGAVEPNEPQGSTALQHIADEKNVRDIPAGMSEYKNSFYKFSILYPQSLKATEFKEEGSKVTVAFEEGASSTRAFQIHVLPYGDTQITEQRLKLDIPSGVFQEPTDVVVDGARATMFFSRDQLLGDTREVWFIQNGFLYEITTAKENDAWLAEIMRTWMFLK